jgi:hypothetical protein
LKTAIPARALEQHSVAGAEHAENAATKYPPEPTGTKEVYVSLVETGKRS